MGFRPTIRLRLTAFYTLLFVMLGAMVLAVSYLRVQSSLRADEASGSLRRVTQQYGYTPEQIRFFNDIKLPPAPAGAPRKADTVGQIISGVQRDIDDDALHELLVGSGLALGVVVLASGFVGWLAAGRVLRPMGRLTARAQSLSEENLSQRIGLDGPADELKELADTIDGMLGRLEVAFEAQRNLAAHVSHELRTPISIIRAEADLVLDDAAASERELGLARSVRSAADRTEALLDSLLALARSESTMNDRETIDLGDLAGDVVGELVGRADAARIDIDLALGTARVHGDRFLLQRLVANLVDNAIKHNHAGGWLKVTVRPEGGEAVLEVSNTGDRMTDEQLEVITKPFHRTDGRRPGYGLGTTVVQSVVRSHGGRVDLAARPDGGLVVTVHLPLAGRPAPVGPASHADTPKPARSSPPASPAPVAAPPEHLPV